MKDQFCDYTTTLRLKNLGFDEPCFGYYDWSNRLIYTFNKEGCTNNRVAKHYTIAPLYQQVMDWLDSKGILLFVHLYSRFSKEEFSWSILHIHKNIFDEYDSPVVYDTRKEALQEGINKALSILEQQNNQ